MFFKIVIPIYNSEEYIDRCIESIEKQTYKDYEIVVINDCTEDDTFEKAKKHKVTAIDPQRKLYIGGARNIGIDYGESVYTLFLDNDDWFESEKALEEIHKTIIENGYPDLVRLSYYCLRGSKDRVDLREDNPKDLVNSLFIAPWTKCVKTNKVVKFPENTLIEDVVQHIAQIDNIETVAVCEEPIVVWNRENVNSCSLESNREKQNSKRISSVYRNIADLMDLRCKHDYCEEHRKWRIACYKDMVKNGNEGTF